MTHKADIDQGRYDPAQPTEELPTAYGGRMDIEPREPGQSLGQAPDPDDADGDQAGDRPDASGSTDRSAGEGVEPRADIDSSGTTAEPNIA